MKILFFVALFVVGCLVYTNKIGDNFHEVSQANFYRSAQISPEHLSQRILDHKIKFVFNLRGDADKDLIIKEVEATRQAGAEHETIFMSATHLPEPDKLDKLLQRFETGPYPMLIHCQGGSDRSGLVSALYLMVIDKKPLDEALGQLDLRYGHLPFGKTNAMDDFFEIYRKTGQGQDIATWIRTTYRTSEYHVD